MTLIDTDPVTFVRSRFPRSKVHELEHRGNKWYAITPDGADVSLYDFPPIGGMTERKAWVRMAQVIMSIEAVTGTLRSLVK